MEEGGDRYSFTWFQQSWIPSGAANVDAAKQFIAFLYSDKATEIFLKGGAVQPVIGAAEMIEDPVKASFMSSYDNGAKAAMGGFASYKSVAGLGSVREVFLDPVNGLVSGNTTVDQWIDGIKEASVQMHENLQ